MNTRHADVIIIGSGLAGLMAAEILSLSKNVIIITKSGIVNSNSMLAQGGIAAAIGEEDDWTDHFLDTVVAGDYHNVEEAVELLVKNGPRMIEQLLQLGVSFDRNERGEFDLAQEGAHGKRRILHAGGDATGKALAQCLINRVKNHTTICEGEMAIDLLMQDDRCVGVWTKNEQGNISYFLAPHTILATGGVGGLFSVTSNDSTITGDGMAMAYRAGAQLEDMEFVQFHPTMLSVHGKGCGLISEAVRGEGAKLVTGSGRLLMEGVHKQKDLAPRDVVAREIHYALLRNEQVYLDIAGVKDFSNRFPTISTLCKDNGVELERGYIPVEPGAHFMMGGVKTDMSGQTTMEGLYAIGEVAHTGVHGANRLASNSLLEAIVFANEVAKTIVSKHANVPITFNDPIVSNNLTINLPTVEEIQRMMTNYVGIIREEQGLQLARKWLEQFLPFIDSIGNMVLLDSLEQVKKINMLTVGWLITTSALMRQESRGGHYRSDFPNNDNKWKKKRTIRRRESNEHHQTTPIVAAISY